MKYLIAMILAMATSMTLATDGMIKQPVDFTLRELSTQGTELVCLQVNGRWQTELRFDFFDPGPEASDDPGLKEFDLWFQLGNWDFTQTVWPRTGPSSTEDHNQGYMRLNDAGALIEALIKGQSVWIQEPLVQGIEGEWTQLVDNSAFRHAATRLAEKGCRDPHIVVSLANAGDTRFLQLLERNAVDMNARRKGYVLRIPLVYYRGQAYSGKLRLKYNGRWDWLEARKH